VAQVFHTKSTLLRSPAKPEFSRLTYRGKGLADLIVAIQVPMVLGISLKDTAKSVFYCRFISSNKG
jgi:hypothetical protein